MRLFLLAFALSAAVGLGVQPADAGDCGDRITAFEASMHKAEAAGAVPSAPQSLNADLSRQPTPESIRLATEAAESHIEAMLTQARSLDAQGNQAECMRLLKDAEIMFDPD